MRRAHIGRHRWLTLTSRELGLMLVSNTETTVLRTQWAIWWLSEDGTWHQPGHTRGQSSSRPSHGVALLCPGLLLPCPSPQSPLLGSPIPPELSAHGAPCQFQPSVLTTLYSSASVPNRQPQRASHWPNPATGLFPSDLVYPARQLGRAMGLQQQDLWGGHWGR